MLEQWVDIVPAGSTGDNLDNSRQAGVRPLQHDAREVKKTDGIILSRSRAYDRLMGCDQLEQLDT